MIDIQSSLELIIKGLNTLLVFNLLLLNLITIDFNNIMTHTKGTNEDIMRFAKKKGASFPIFGKLDCENGDITHPLYQFLKKSISKVLADLLN